jgi:hypothetical protein
MKPIWVLIALGVAVAAFLLGAFGTPYVTGLQIKRAVDSGDREALSKYIDFPRVRLNLKEQINESLVSGVQDHGAESIGGAFGLALSRILAESAVDLLVTPALVDHMLIDRRRAISTARMGYVAMDTFVMSTDDQMRVVLRRQGFAWQITEISLPTADLFSASLRAAFVPPLDDQ